MKKILLPLFMIAMCNTPAALLRAQEINPVTGEPLLHCGTDEAIKELFDKNPEIKANFEKIQAEQLLNAQKNPQLPQPYTIYTIPVVVHVVHNYGAENISDAQVKDAISILSRDYQKQNADTASVMTAFKSNIANVGIIFKLAQLDPNGNCTNGIDRIVSPLTYAASDASKLNDWPSNKYLNVWTVSTIGTAGVAGYSYYPGISANKDGVLILSNYIGSIGTGTPGTSRALTHEVGHWLNLQHPWGNNNQPGVACGDDLVTDTPVTKGWTSCNITSATAGVCNPGTPENIENYMDYAYCQKMFTNGQRSRMLTAITSATGGRNNVWSSANLTATGVNAAAQLCTADFSANRNVVCVGASISFSDLSWNAAPTSWKWDFDNNGTIDATTQNPTYAYSTAGVYAVTLTVSDGVSTKTTTKSPYVTVLANTASTQAPYVEGFENTGFPYNDCYLTTASGTGTPWVRTTSAFYTGTASMKLDNFSQTVGDVDAFITPAIDMSTVTSPTMTFKVAFAQRDTSDKGQLTVLTSTNCGNSWNQRYSKSGATLATAGLVSSSFTPSSTNQWREETVSIANTAGQTDTRFKFQYKSNGGGNNIYIDDINIADANAGVAEEFQNGFDLTVFPNPFNDNTTISFNILKKYNVSISVYDIVGKEILPVSAKTELSAGNYSLPLNRNMLKPGIYFVKMDVDGYSVMKKMIVQ